MIVPSHMHSNYLLMITFLLSFSTDLAVYCDPLPLTSSSSSSQSTSSTVSPPAPSAAALYAASSVNFRCPEQFGYYADEYNCSKYFVCVFGEALHESCTGGLRFSSELQTCDWPRNVVCPSEGKCLYHLYFMLIISFRLVSRTVEKALDHTFIT